MNRRCLASFASIKTDFPCRPLFYAKNKFFYDSKTSSITCFECNKRLLPPDENAVLNHKCNFADTLNLEDVKLASSLETCSYNSALQLPVNKLSSNRTSETVNQTSLSDDSRRMEDISRHAKKLSVDDVQMEKLENRLKSYNRANFVFPIAVRALALAGYYYVGPKDTVKCFSCKRKAEKWVTGDVPLVEHRRLNPECIFAQMPEGERHTRLDNNVKPTRLV